MGGLLISGESVIRSSDRSVDGAVAVIGVLPVKDASQAQARIFAFME